MLLVNLQAWSSILAENMILEFEYLGLSATYVEEGLGMERTCGCLLSAYYVRGASLLLPEAAGSTPMLPHSTGGDVQSSGVSCPILHH